MGSSFRYVDLPIELKLKILEHAFGANVDTRPTFTRPLSRLTSRSYRIADEFFDTFYNCTIPSELIVYPDAGFRQLFVSKVFLQDALPVFAKGNIITVQLKSHRSKTTRSNNNGVVIKTLKDVLLKARRLTIIHSLVVRDNHLDEKRLIPLLTLSRLKECNLVVEKPRFWYHGTNDLRTTMTGSLASFGYVHRHHLRVVSTEELDAIESWKHHPKGFLKLFSENHAPSEVNWHRNALLPVFQSHGFTGRGYLQIDIVACRKCPPETLPKPGTLPKPSSFLMLLNSSDLAILNVDISPISRRFWSTRNLADRRRLRRWETEDD